MKYEGVILAIHLGFRGGINQTSGGCIMPNIAFVLKGEIARLARKEIRAELESLKKTVARQRTEVSELKRRLAEAERRLGRAIKQKVAPGAAPAEGEDQPRVRFSPKHLASRRKRLGLSAAELGVLLGVSAQTVYNWEMGKSRPRASQLPAIAGLRSLGKRQARATLSATAPETQE
jgi:DNA-binding transcriptional regulator YiaG